MINVGIIGLGRSGWELYAVPMMTLPDYRLIAVSDPSAVRLTTAAREFGVKAYVNSAELIADPEVDLIVVAAPSHVHAMLVTAALEQGKHVVVEKPMALSLAEAKRCRSLPVRPVAY